MLWILLLALSLAALFYLVQPLLNAQKDTASIDDQDYLVAQLADIEADLKNGLLSEADAAAAKVEAERRVMSAQKEDAMRTGAAPETRMAVVVLIAAAPVAALALYMGIGGPAATDAPPAGVITAGVAAPGAGQATADGQSAASVGESIRQLASRLEQSPNDLEGWILLAESYAATGQFLQAASAYDRATALAPERADLLAALGETRIVANNGIVDTGALEPLEQALALDPDEPRARFYRALRTYQGGDARAALDDWIAILNAAPPGAPWVSIVADQIKTVSGEIDLDIAALDLSERARARVAGEVTPDAIEARIAAGGAPYTDWIELINAYANAGDRERAADAMARARQRYAEAPFVLRELNGLASNLGLLVTDGATRESSARGPTSDQIADAAAMSADDREAMIQNMVEGLAARLEAQPDDVEGWLMLGRSYAVLSRGAESLAAFEKAASLAPTDKEVLIAHAQAMLGQLEREGAAIDAPALARLNEIAQLDPQEPFALYFLGVAANQKGETARAAEYWRALLAQLPEGSEDANRMRAMIEGL
ncbi:MAG: c-type cytochrome biogenesis protein CcmI [Pseudomonadota bacterium]